MSHFYENRQSTYQNDDMDDGQSYAEEGEMMGQSMGQGSHYGHSGMPTSPRSWVQYPEYPVPMAESMSHAPSNTTSLRGPRPLPEPFLQRQVYRPPDQAVDEMDEEGEEDEYIDGNEPPIMHSVYQGQDYVTPLRPQRTFVGGFFKGLKKVFRGGKAKDKTLRRKGTFGTDGTSATNITTGDTLPRYLSNPSIGPSNPQFARRLTMAVNNGNLPPETTSMAFESLSPPHHDPSQPLPFQFRPDVNNDLPLRPQAVTPQFPSVFITPPTDSYAEGERAEVENADQYDAPPPPDQEPPEEYSDEEDEDDDDDEQPRPLDMAQERTTMMMYNNTDPSHPSQHGHTPSQGHPGSSSHPTNNSHPYSNAPSQSHHHSVAPSQSHHYSNAPSQSQHYSNAPSQSQPYSNAPSQSQPYSHSPSQYPQYSAGPSTGVSRMPSGRRVSYPSELPTRATMEAMQGRQMPPPVPPLPETSISMGMSMVPTSPRRRTFFSRRPTTTGTSVLSPKSGTSMTRTMTTTTSGYTVSTAATSCYDPSFASDLNPVEKFFKGLYNLPWIAQERVTVDYRPADSPRAKAKVKSTAKKAMPSWYRSLVTRSRVGTIDAVSNADPTMSMGETMSPNTSRRRSREHRSHRHHSPTKPSRRHRRHRRRTATTMTTDTGMTATTADGHRRAASPLVPGTYPYAYPSYPYPYPYPYPAMSPPPRESGSRSASPRGARKHKSSRDHKYGVYPQAAYQPMTMPAGPSPPPGMPAGPVYFVSPSPPGSNHGDSHPGGVPVQVSPVMWHYIPAAFDPNQHRMRSPVQHAS
ncbi:hypothetical protein BJ165DRAFT_1528693 [Panaeolus papilionaceus]|nr:hypothetical protein BJ165DRAFT_1528693 [Panaeolus papilionaceus]